MMSKEDPLAGLVEDFFMKYLNLERGYSSNTITSYFICIKMLFWFCSQLLEKEVVELQLKEIDAKNVLAFLDYLEVDRGNLPQTRNVRLAAIHSFFCFVASQDPTTLKVSRRICAIKPKRVAHKVLPSLTREQVDAIIGAVETNDLWGLRDKVLFLLLYNTGARISEIVNLKIGDLRMEEPYYVILTGKGNKQRSVALWEEVIKVIKLYLKHRSQYADQPFLILNTRGFPISRFGIGYIVNKYYELAQLKCPSLSEIHVTPHTFRHTYALLNVVAGNAVPTIRDQLGHASVDTTNSYYRLPMEMKQKALESFHPPKNASTPDSLPSPFDKLSFLERMDRMCRPNGTLARPRSGPR